MGLISRVSSRTYRFLDVKKMEIPDSVRYLNKKPAAEQFSHNFSESNTVIKKPKPSKLRSLKLSKSYTSNLNRKKKNNKNTTNFESYCSSDSDDTENNHITDCISFQVPSGNDTITRSHSEYGIVQNMGFSHRNKKSSKSTSSKSSSRSHSKNSSIDLI